MDVARDDRKLWSGQSQRCQMGRYVMSFLDAQTLAKVRSQGITSAVFSLAQSCTAIGWGRASDYFGRKPMVILALFLTMLMSLIWGFSTSLPWAIIARAGSGACNGNGRPGTIY